MVSSRSSLVWMVALVSATPPVAQAQRVSSLAGSPASVSARLGERPAAEGSMRGSIVESALATGARLWTTAATRERRSATAATQATASKPFWTRTKLLIVGGAAIILAAIVVAEMRESCREQGPACFD